jgi:ATP-dependent DNA helicase RecG
LSLPLTLDSTISAVKGIGEKYAQLLGDNGIFSVLDLLLRFPLTYIDFTNIAQTVEPGEQIYQIEVQRYNLSRNYRRRLSVLRIDGVMNSIDLQVVFFNRPYLKNQLTKGKRLYCFGKMEERGGIWQLVNPVMFEEVSGRPVVPVYGSIGNIKSGTLRKIFTNIFASIQDSPESLPEHLVTKRGFRPAVQTLRHIHFPEIYDEEALETSKNRFIYQEFLYFQLELQTLRNHFRQVPRVHPYNIDSGSLETLTSNLPFQLTRDQLTALEDIVKDLQSPSAMQRLLQGDVGSGKTIVSFLALRLAAANGYQGAFLAPTEILAAQHFQNALTCFDANEIALLTGSMTAKQKKEIRSRLESGEIKVVFGTHALLSESVQFKNLSMIVIDEQHRFGVSQRAALYYKGRSVDLLVTTATPIPRTLVLSLYNDLSLSSIKTKPQGRLPIKTKIIGSTRRDEFYQWLSRRIQDGEKAYIVLPLIEPSEFFSQLRSIEDETEFFQETMMPSTIGIVTGRTDIQKKDEILKRFADGEIRALLATTVIEVGIDVKDATIMVIENADRYGMAQLHQLRGRVGRGPTQSHCYLIPSQRTTEKGKKRLDTIAGTNDGFKIAEMDLKMRGGGVIPGLQQSGYLDFKLGDPRQHYDMFSQAREDAGEIIKESALRNKGIDEFLARVDEKIKQLNFS